MILHLSEDIWVYSIRSPLFLSEMYVQEDGSPAPRARCLSTAGENRRERFKIDKEKGAVLFPGVMYLGESQENVRCGDNEVPFVQSVFPELGITVGCGPRAHPGISLALYLSVVHPTRVTIGLGICRVTFIKGTP